MMWTSWPRIKHKSKQKFQDESIKGKLKSSNQLRVFYPIILAWICVGVKGAGAPSTAQCPPGDIIPGCPCYNFADGLFLECTGSTEESLRTTLIRILNQSKSNDAVIQSLSIYELDRKIEEIRSNVFPAGLLIRHLQISQSSVREISEEAFQKISHTLESLTFVSGKLASVPQKAFATLNHLTALDLEGNLIHDLPSFSFFGLALRKLNVKANQIVKISEYAFAGLEKSLTDLNLAENKIRLFPMTALRRLEHLISLKLAWNEISQLPEDGYSRLDNLNFLDLSSNNFLVIPLNCFRCCPSIRTLSLYYNSVEKVDKDAFISLIDLETIDLSHNKIMFLDVATFRANQKLKSIDLGHNHIHYIKGIFSRLPELQELILVENNILEIPAHAFSGCISLSVIYLQYNAIRKMDSRGLTTLEQLTQLHLSGNYIQYIPRNFFDHSENLSSLSLDGNNIREIEVGIFTKLKQLRELRLQDNQITEVKRGVFTPLPSLLELHLQNNAITDMETSALSSLLNLQHVNLQGNLLAVLGDVFQISKSTDIDSSSLISIQLDNNGLGVLHNDSFKGQANIRIMWLSHNRLTKLQAPLFRDLVLVERLYLTNNSISHIEDTAFQPMQALKFLDLSINKLTHISVEIFSELHELEELHLSDNEIRRLDPYALTSLKRLRVLDLSNNRLNTLHDTMFQEGLPIRSLNLRNCSISSIDANTFRGLNNLYELNLDHNRLAANALDKMNIPGLRILHISQNNFSLISNKSFDGLPSLQHLVIEFAHIYKIPLDFFSRSKNLIKITLKNNQLKTLPPSLFFSLESLKEIKLDGNYFQDIPYEVFANASSIEFLSLAYNIILHVDISRLYGLINLRELDLHGNYIKSLSGFTTANLVKLIYIDLSHNHLITLPVNFFLHSNMLRKVELAGNKLHQIPAVALSAQNIPSLAWLNVSANPFMRINEITKEANYPALQEIHISFTNLTIITSQDFEIFSELLHLFLNNNMIIRVLPGAFHNLLKLLTLDLSSNHLGFLPQERLKGLKHLRLLNLTHNRLKELEHFPNDLKALQLLDLSFNQISIIDTNTFQHLGNLAELNLIGNRISAIAIDAFKPLKKLRILDISKNHLEILPLNAFKPLEAHIRSLRAEDNPLHCDCESQDLWEWLRDHQKLVKVNSRESISLMHNRGPNNRGNEDNEIGNLNHMTGFLRCEKPPQLKGRIFLDLDPRAFCATPIISKLTIQDVQPHSILVSWQSRNYSSLDGYQVIFHALDRSDEIHNKMLERNSYSVRLSKLQSNTRYRICVVAVSNWLNPRLSSEDDESIKTLQHLNFNDSRDIKHKKLSLSKLLDTAASRCTEALTVDVSHVVLSSKGSSLSRGKVSKNVENSILTRRLGLIIGCCMGFVVFILLISILGYLKVKKQREAAKRDQQAVPPEYISYRHFSIQSGEAGQAAKHIQETISLDSQMQQPQQQQQSQQQSIPSFITTTCPDVTPNV